MADPFDYLESRDDADELIRDFGAAVQLKRDVLTGPSYDPIMTPVTFDTFAVKVDFTWKQMQGGTVQEGDQRWLVAAGPLDAQGVRVIAAPDKIGDITVVTGNTLQPAGTVVLFDCHCRF